jgi:hypothetical protein
MMTATPTFSLPSLQPQAPEPVRQCRQGRARRAALLAAFDRRPFDSIHTHAAPCLLFAGTLPLLCALHPSW